MAIAFAAWAVWAVLAFAAWAIDSHPLAGLIPLVVLIGGFEVVLAIHTGVERVGRYIQRVHERGDVTAPAWEHVAMGMGARWLSPGGLDSLFGGVFLLATFVNLLPVLFAGTAMEAGVGITCHAAFSIRVLLARRFAAQQRAHDLAALDQVISSNSLVSKIQQER
jgi:hypothetical protein